MSKSKKFNLKPIPHDIIKAGELSRKFLQSLGLSDSIIQDQILVIQELIRNGINCGKCKSTENEIFVQLQVSENTITIEVKNPVDETCFQRIAEFDKTIQFIRGYQDPFEAYQIMQKYAANRTNVGVIDGLALSRIAYKGKAILDFYVGEDNMLNQSAIRSIPKTPN